ncbi:MAG: DUF4838 domain-containing protein [Limisphaerales bacterium]
MVLLRAAVSLLILGSALASENRASAEVVLAQAKHSAWVIEPISTNVAGITFAAEELQKYLRQMGGAKLPIVSKAGQRKAIVIGLRTDLVTKEHVLPPRKAGYDGYAISIRDDSIVIAGDNGPGCIYGVYNLLEHLGCRWFYPTIDLKDPEVVPKLSTISLKTNAWAIASPIRYRICNGDAWFFEMDYSAALKEMDWAMKNRYNAMGWQAAVNTSKRSLLQQYDDLRHAGITSGIEKRGMFIHGPAHSFDHFLKSDIYFAKHPEWFGMRNGKRVPQAALGAQFCWSNPEARAQFTANAEAFVTNAPLIKIFCTVPFDGGVACDCPECHKQGPSNLLMVLMKELIERLQRSRPDVQVETVGGYGAVPNPPSNLAIIHPHQRIVWAQWGRHHGIGYDDPKYDRHNLDLWRVAAKGGLTICQYYTDNFAEPWVMGPFTTAMQSDRQYFLKHNVDAVYMLMYSPGYWWNHSLNGYIAGRCFYDVSLSPRDEISDYALHYFGTNAGPALAKYYGEWADNIELSYRVRGEARKQDRMTLARERHDLIAPAVAAAKTSVERYRVAKVEMLHGLAEQLCELHRQHDLVRWLRMQGKFDDASRMLTKGRATVDETLKLFLKIANTKEGLIDAGEVRGFITLAMKNWIEEEAKAIAAKDRTRPAWLDRDLAETEVKPGEPL